MDDSNYRTNTAARPVHWVAAETIGLGWIQSVRHVLTHGQAHWDEDVGMTEILGLTIEIVTPSESDPVIDSYGDPEVLSRTLEKFSKGSHLPDRPFTYGERIYSMAGIDQFEWMAQRLLAKPETKSATINLLIPGSQAANLPCLTALDAKIRQGHLDLQFFFRSQNIFGRQYANLAALTRLQAKLARRCGVQTGALRGYVASAHIYDFDRAAAEELASGRDVQIVDQYYHHGPSSIRKGP
jgi:thymidylate synthase